MTQYQVPTEQLRLSGPVARPAPGTLPLRGDIAHIALADRFLVPHYAVPQIRAIGGASVTLRLAPSEESGAVTELNAGTRFELLDTAGEWAWGAVGPEGPSGWVPASALVPQGQ